MLSQADQEPSPTMIESAPATASAAAPSLSTQAVSGDVLRIALVGALLGGLLLTLIPCFFPILSLTTLSLSKSGGAPRAARMVGPACEARVVGHCFTLGALLIGLSTTHIS